MLDPVVAIGRQQENPVDAIVARPALPQEPETQDVLAEPAVPRARVGVSTNTHT